MLTKHASLRQSRAVCERKLFRIMESVILLLAMVIFLGQLAVICWSANILYISSVASPSHFLWSQRLFERLAELGHNMTVVNLYKHGSVRSVHLIKLDGIIDELATEDEDYIEFGQLDPFEMHVSFAELELFVCQRAIESVGFQSLMEYPKDFQFQLVIHDHLAGPCLLTLLAKFGYPQLVFASAYNRLSTTSYSLGSLIYPGFIPNQVYDILGPMNFYQRCFNFLLSFWELFFKEFICYPKLDKFLEVELNLTKSVSSFEKRSSLAILNSNPILEPSEPKLRNVIQAGGLHIRPPKLLPPYLLSVVENSSSGVIFFSLGTNARSDVLEDEILLKVITTMGKLSPYTFLWKLDSEDSLPMKLPPNVVTSAWFPQNDLLAHPKLKLFITHGGLLSIQEAAWHATPIIGIPIYGDQFGNINKMVQLGVGRRLSLLDFTAQQLEDCIIEVATAESYKKNVLQLSKLLRDRKETPLDKAVWSIEWVMRNEESSHVWNQSLISYGFLEKYSFDVMIALVTILVTIIFLILLLIKSIVIRLTDNKNKVD